MNDRKTLRMQLERYLVQYPQESSVVSQMLTALPKEDVFYRTAHPGHFTGSAVAVDAALSQVLLIHHRKLQIWVQPGGHADGEEDVANVARRELLEETGIEGELFANKHEIFDVDIHTIPARGDEPTHLHLDLRYLFQVQNTHQLRGEIAEIEDLKWVPLSDVAYFRVDTSVLRLCDKLQKLRQTLLV